MTVNAGNAWSLRQRWICCPGAMLALAIAALPGASALAQDADGPDAKGVTAPSIASSLPYGGDPFGDRERLAKTGITYNLFYTNDVLANVRGGLRRGTINQGKLEGAVTVDLEKRYGLKGLSFFANGFQIDNTGRMRRDYVGGLDTIAAIEGRPTLRLSEIWLEQRFAGDKATIRIGQLAADSEFFFSSTSTMFLQADWAAITALNLPSGGAAYPLSTPGIRVKYEPTPNFVVLAAVLNGDPAGPGAGDEQRRNSNGLNFRVEDPPFVIGEAQIRQNTGKQDRGLARTLKFGAWGHFGAFNDQRFAADGGLLADPARSGAAAWRQGNGGVYLVVDQQLYRPDGGAADSGISVYSRISGSPSDRNPISFYLDGGIVFAGMVPNRPDDKFGAGFIYSQFSDSLRAFDKDTVRLTGAQAPVRDYEANLEVTYTAQILPGWLMQPTAQFIWHPNGDASRDATVVGLRNYIHY